ncbi:MAG: hypothetical protein HY865_22370 [Chloroflexi bacterium]|nr:hypothetical protein [Chloroflexota bacterium]
MTTYSTPSPSVNFRLNEEDKQLLRDLAKLLRTSQVMALRLVLREVVPALKAHAEEEKTKAQTKKASRHIVN